MSKAHGKRMKLAGAWSGPFPVDEFDVPVF
jgi:hypothetical protein